MAVRNRWCLLALPLRIKGLGRPLLQVFGPCLVSRSMSTWHFFLLNLGQQEPTGLACSHSVLAWAPEGMEEPRLEDLSLGSASGVGRGTS